MAGPELAIPDAEPFIRLQDVSKSFEGNQVLRGAGRACSAARCTRCSVPTGRASQR